MVQLSSYFTLYIVIRVLLHAVLSPSTHEILYSDSIPVQHIFIWSRVKLFSKFNWLNCKYTNNINFNWCTRNYARNVYLGDFSTNMPDKQQFDTRYLVFYNPSPPRMFLSLDLLWEYRIQHGANGPLYVTSSYSTWIFCRGVSGFATDCPCGVWCRGLNTCLLHVDPPFGNRILNNSWAVGLT